MNLNLLAPDIQEEILFLPRVESGRDPVREHAVRAIAAMADWGRQQKMWTEVAGGHGRWPVAVPLAHLAKATTPRPE